MAGLVKQLYEKNGNEFIPIEPVGGGGGGGGVDPGTFTAEVVEVTSPEKASASVSIDSKNSFNFKFGLPRGIKGDPGAQGRPGPVGPPGPAGESAITSRQIMAFKHSLEPIVPKPVGGSWNVDTNTITYPEGWGPSDGLERPVWMSIGDFLAITPNNPTWSDPIIISGVDGANGVDGNTTEYVYKQWKSTTNPPDTPVENTQTGVAPPNWTASPSGIDLEWPVEYVSIRKKLDNGNWGPWRKPTIWSKWGVNGIDGDGVEYIYKVNNGIALKPEDNPTPEDTSSDEYQEKGEFEDIEYVPTDKGWTDNPTGVSPVGNTHEWVCVRKFRKGVWGRFSNPTLWSKYGENGKSGVSSIVKYAITSGSDVIPNFEASSVDPGSNWGLAVPNRVGTQAIWSIQAYFDENYNFVTVTDSTGHKVSGWQGPWIITGANGADGVAPNYKTYVFQLSDDRPAPPVGNDPNPGYPWIDYPNAPGNWWQCIGTVRGIDDTVLEWSEVIPVNGKDGIAQDGKWTEFRFNYSPSLSMSLNPDLKYVRDLDRYGWYTTVPQIPEGNYVFMIKAVIDPAKNKVVDGWSNPVRISGEKGDPGEDGPAGKPGPSGAQGISGVPGITTIGYYSLGTEEVQDARYNDSIASDVTPEEDNYGPTGWSTKIPEVTHEKPYVWAIQSRIRYKQNYYGDGSPIIGSYTKILEDKWSAPFRLTGLNGVSTEIKKNQIIYPNGTYDKTKRYITTQFTAPYVLDPNDGNYYVLNTDDPNGWLGTEQFNRTPAQDFAINKTNSSWVQFTPNEAIYTKIGIIGNGLIGSAVFNEDFMFSQQGVLNGQSVKTLYKISSELPVLSFDDSTSLTPSGWGSRPSQEDIPEGMVLYYIRGVIKDGSLNGTWKGPFPISMYTEDSSHYELFNKQDPYGKDSVWYPNYCVNLITGEVWSGAGKVNFKADGSGQLADGNINWTKDGVTNITGTITSNKIIAGDPKSNHIEITPDRNDGNGTSITMIDRQGNIKGKLGFFEGGLGHLHFTSGIDNFVNITPERINIVNGDKEVLITKSNVYLSQIPITGVALSILDLGTSSLAEWRGEGIVTNKSSYPRTLKINKLIPGAVIFVRTVWEKGDITVTASPYNIELSGGGDVTSTVISGKDVHPRIFYCDGVKWNEFRGA